MNNELATISNAMSMWEDEKKLQEIKSIFAPKLTELEFKFFIGMGKANDLNPFLREIWSVKYADNTPAQIFIGRDGYRKSAQRNPDYKIHIVESIYANDDFKYSNGAISHSFCMVNRGKLIGAYCLVYKKSVDIPIHVICELKDYSTGKSLWHPETGKQATMIKKVAEAQALRMAFQEQYSGSYSEFEESNVIEGKWTARQTQAEKMSSLLTKKGINNNAKNTIDSQSSNNSIDSSDSTDSSLAVDSNNSNSNVEVQNIKGNRVEQVAEAGESKDCFANQKSEPGSCTDQQLEVISCLIHEKSVDKTGELRCLDHFYVSKFSELSEIQAQAVIKKLDSME